MQCAEAEIRRRQYCLLPDKRPERESRSHGSVNGITSGLHDFDSGAGGELVNAGDHGVLRVRGIERRGGESCSEQKCERADRQGEMDHFEVRRFEQGAHRWNELTRLELTRLV